MKRIGLVVAYDGTNYCGWQTQPNGITVQGVLNETLSELLGEKIETIGASRTDAGVHAMGNVAVFDTNTRIPGEKISYALNQRLPEDIRIQLSEEVEPDFHPRYCDSEKTYEYRILNRKFPVPTERLYTYFYHYKLDVDKMKAATSYLIGQHDFASFCGAKAQVKTTIRTVTGIDVWRDGDIVTIRVTGTGFLYNMVRIIAGTLIEVGNGQYPPERVKTILEACNREMAGPTAPDEIYNHPKTSYVATFVGNANILHGAAERIQGENAIVKIGNDRVIVKLETSQQNTEDTGVKQYLSAGEKVTLAVRSENILLQETAVIGDTGTDYRDAVDISVADGSLDAHNKNSVSGLQATVTEKNFAGGQLRVTLKLSDGTQLIASRYGIDASIAEGQTVRCSFLPTDAVLVDREDIHEEA